MLKKIPANSLPSAQSSLGVIAAFIFCGMYWLYLIFMAQMVIVNDAIGYEQLGKLLAEDGWREYFRTGPHREPLYPWMVSVAMRLEDCFSVSYQTIQKILQILILLLTQILTIVILKKLKVASGLVSLIVLYGGFSPALVNTAFSLYSEISTFPLILSIVLLSHQSWKSLQGLRNRRGVVLLAGGVGIFLTLMTFVKGIFEAVVPFLLLPYFIFAIRCVIKKEKYLFRQVFLFLMVVSVTFYGPITFYKFANKRYNGVFTLTDRGPWALYGNTARRLEPLTAKQWLVALSYASSKELCRELFTEEECLFWSPALSDFLAHQKLAELRKTDLSPDGINGALIKLSLEKIFTRPGPYLLLTGLEAFKMFFWESTKMEIVAYPDWLERLYHFKPFSYGTSFFMAWLTFLALLHLIKFLWSQQKTFLGAPGILQESKILLSWILLLIVLFTGAHSFFHILPRYILPLAPLYLIAIAFFLHCIKIQRVLSQTSSKEKFGILL